MNQRVARAFLTAALLLPLRMAAQVRGPVFAGVPRGSVTLGFGSQSELRNAFSRPAIFLVGPMLYPDYYQPSPLPPPQVVVVQVPAASPENKPEPSGVHPLLIEWQDDRFVRLTARVAGLYG
jgi:hypothetical protein